MSRRIEIELTSKVDDDSWTWRAAGARLPKGTLAGSLLPAGVKVGEILRADVENDIDGIAVLAVLPPKEKPAEPERIEILPKTDRPVPPVTTQRVERSARPPRPERGGGRPERGDRPDRADRGRPESRRPDRDRKDRERPDRARADRPQAERRPPRPPRAERPKPEPAPERPKPKRLSPGHTHRNAILAALPPEQRPIAEQVVRGGLPAVRQAIETQNALLKAENQTPIKPEPLMAMAEDLLPRLKAAEWRDRAEAASSAGDDLSLRDLRSVVSSAELARDDEARELARTLRETLDNRVKTERDSWLGEITEALTAGRVVRALRIASRPPDPTTRFPVELGGELAAAAGAAMTADAPPDRWLAVLDAVSVSPVRRTVQPAGLPPEPPVEFLNTVKALANRVPALGPLVGIAPGTPPPPPRPPQRRPPGAAAPVAAAPDSDNGGETPKTTEEPVPAADT
ncbi:MAG TPA: hypothetical protein VFB78_14340 [Acidimicrobiales bacterium]|nr:hypothetical protein [Acidimicrobiales bacterium]